MKLSIPALALLTCLALIAVLVAVFLPGTFAMLLSEDRQLILWAKDISLALPVILLPLAGFLALSFYFIDRWLFRFHHRMSQEEREAEARSSD